MRFLTTDILSGSANLGSGSWRMSIDGEWVQSASKATYAVEDPGRGEFLARVPLADADDVNRAVSAARAAFESSRWRRMPDYERGRLIWRIGDLILKHQEKLAVLESLNQGMPLAAARQSVVEAARVFHYFAGLADKNDGTAKRLVSNGREFQAHTVHEPVGVVALITPWNGPLRMTSWKIAPALAAGCACVHKPADETPLTALALAEIMQEAGLPEGVVNVVTGHADTGRALVEHNDVDAVSFTGSTDTGRTIIKSAVGNLKKLTLELGGKSAVIVLPDADLSEAIPAAAAAIFSNAGQVCTAGSRLIVHRSIHDEVVEGILLRAHSLRLGYGLDLGTDMGPLISAAHRNRVAGFVDGAGSLGAEIHSVPKHAEHGYFYPPTLLTAVDRHSPAFQEEIFGPVLTVSAFTDTDEAIELGNDTRFGLAASVWTRSIKEAHRVSSKMRAGRVGINVHGLPDVTMPTGGYKESGWGRELGPEGIRPYEEIKSVFYAV